MNLLNFRKQTNKLLAQHSHFCSQVREERLCLKEAKEVLQITTSAQKICQEVAEGVQQLAHKQITSLVSSCLKTVFGNDAYKFTIKFSQKRGKTEAQIMFTENGKEVDPKEASSGGQIDVAAFALRLACLWLQKPQRRKVLILDEPYKYVNGEQYQERMGQFLYSLAKDMNLQVIMVTDDSWLKVGKVIQL